MIIQPSPLENNCSTIIVLSVMECKDTRAASLGALRRGRPRLPSTSDVIWQSLSRTLPELETRKLRLPPSLVRDAVRF